MIIGIFIARAALLAEIKRSSAPSQGFHIVCDDFKIEKRFCVAPVSAPYPTKHGVEVLPLADAVAMLRG